MIVAISNIYIWIHTVALVAVLLEHFNLTRVYTAFTISNLAFFILNLVDKNTQYHALFALLSSLILGVVFTILLVWFSYDLSRIEKLKKQTQQWIALP